jgi:tetratricopeptide (TPR) repeat protein
MQSESLPDIARRYGVDDVPGASIPHARLQKILHSLHYSGQLTQAALAFLQQQGLHALYCLANGALPYDRFHVLALAEQTKRMHAATAAQLAHEAEERSREEKRQLAYAQAAAAHRARKNAPASQAKLANQHLRARYGIDRFVEPQDFGRLMHILKRVDAGQRLDEEDVVWLSTGDENYFTPELRNAYHQLEADFFARAFHQTRDPWAAVNASSHYRKCGCADAADALLSMISIKQPSPKIQAALWTTHGGALRDLKRWDEALHLGERAHALQPKDYRPCTLLGAIYMETGQHTQGQMWYDKAIKCGATIDVIDRDIRTILSRLLPDRQSALKDFLLHKDPTRFAWIQRR